MEMQRQRARNARAKGSDIGWKDEISSLDLSVKNAEFIGYEKLEDENDIADIVIDGKLSNKAVQGQEIILIFDRTPFYAESGGQVGDTGLIKNADAQIQVNNVTKSTNGLFLHHCTVNNGEIKKGDKVKLFVDVKKRFATMRNHTATHLLHKALKVVLGDHIQQAGSLVSPDRLRFDFNHFAQVSKEELMKVEQLVNEQIYNAIDVQTQVMDIEDAKNTGAMSLFDEKYGETVRVLSIGEFSKEFCGGTHVKNSNDIGMFKIVSEGGVASGVRRIEAITGYSVYNFIVEKQELIENVSSTLKTSQDNLQKRATDLMAENKTLQKKIKEVQSAGAKTDIDSVIKSAKKIKDVNLVMSSYEDMEDDILRDFAQNIIDKVENAIVVFSNLNSENQKLTFLCMVSKNLIPKYNAGKIVKEVAMVTGGNGGGKPNMAMAGGKDVSKVQDALSKAEEVVENI